MIKRGVYQHFKGGKYRVHYVAKHSETLEEFVVYEALYDNKNGKYWIRPAEMFEGHKEKDGQKIKRFTFIDNE